MTGKLREIFQRNRKREREIRSESPASTTLPCVQRNPTQFSDTQRESERDSEHSQTLIRRSNTCFAGETAKAAQGTAAS